VKALFWAAVISGPVAVGLWALAGLSPGTVELWYSRTLYPALMGPWSRAWGFFPFTVAPWLVVGALVAGGALFFVLPPLRTLSLFGAAGSMLMAWFVLGWGLNYQRASWAENHGKSVRGGTIADLEALAGRLADRADALRPLAFLPGTPDWSGPVVREAVTTAYQRAGLSDPLLGGAWGDPKIFPLPDLMSWTGIAGIFFPFTGEPLVNPGPRDWQLPFTSAHEAAHLRGWAREDEANFLAFWVLHDDADPALAYSAWGSALLYVASALESVGPEGKAAWGRILRRIDPGVRADWQGSFSYWDRFRGPVRQASQAVNDFYLKSQGQSDGVKSYGRMVDLLLAWETDF